MLVFRPLLFLTLLLAAGGLRADVNDPGAEAFNAGVRQFDSGQWAAAKTHIEAALAVGLTSASLFYNLGVVCYRLGDYDCADQTFRKLVNGTNSALASYNLGLTALAREHHEAARHWFARSAGPDSPEKIRALARVQLEKLKPHPAVIADGASAARTAYLAISGGFDSNIAGLPETAVSAEGGVFADALAMGALQWPVPADAQLSLEAAGYARHHPTEEGFDTRLVQGRVAWSQEQKNRKLGAALLLSQSWFDNDALERRLGLEGIYQWYRCNVIGRPDRCAFTLAVANVDGGEGFGAYDGQWYRLQLRALKRVQSWRLDLEYEWERNDRRDLTLPDQFVSVSPRHHTVDLAARYPLYPDLVVGASGAVRYSRYPDRYVLLVDGRQDIRRRMDYRFEAGLLTEYDLDGHWLLRAEWTVRDNRSRIDRYDYRRHTVMATLEAVF